MIIKKLALEGFRSYGDKIEIDFGSKNVVAIVGDNGAGKTSLIEAMTFAIYGRSATTDARDVKIRDLVNNKRKKAVIELEFIKNGMHYKILREVRKNSRELGKVILFNLTTGQKTIGVKNVERELKDKIIGMDYETFVSSTLIRQGEIEKLSELTDAKRKELFVRIFGLDIYKHFEEKAKEKKRQLSLQLEKLRGEKEFLEREVAKETKYLEQKTQIQEQLSELEKRAVILKSELENLEKIEKEKNEAYLKFMALSGTLEGISNQIKDYEKRLAKREQILKDKERIENELAGYQGLDEAKKKIEADIGEINEKLTDIKSEISALTGEINQLNKRIKEEQENFRKIQIVKGKCPLCKRPISTEEEKQHILEEYSRIIQELREKIKEYETKKIQLNREYKKNELVRKKLENTMTEIRNKLIKKERLEGELTSMIKNLEDFENMSEILSKLKDEYETKKKEAEILREKVKDLEKIRERINQLRRAEKDIMAEIASLRTELSNIENVLEEIKEKKENLMKIEEDMKDKEDKKHIYALLEHIFSRKGIPTQILKNLIQMVEKEAQKILEELTNGRMTLYLNFEQRGDEEVIKLKVFSDGNLRQLKTFSGGERIRINLALRLGISETLAKLKGLHGRLDFLIIDEGFGFLDQQGRETLTEILKKLSERFKQIFVITHIEDIKEDFDTKLKVYKDKEGFSQVKWDFD